MRCIGAELRGEPVEDGDRLVREWTRQLDIKDAIHQSNCFEHAADLPTVGRVGVAIPEQPHRVVGLDQCGERLHHIVTLCNVR